jgi:hypothetical protein
MDKLGCLTSLVFVLGLALGCGGGSGAPDAAIDPDAPPSAAADAQAADAPGADAPAEECDLGTATNSAAASNASLFGAVVPFADGDDLPAGTYQIGYVDGCIKYAPSQWWTIHARDDGNTSWWLVGADDSDKKVLMPGIVGHLPGTSTGTGDQNGHEEFDDCVTANLALEPLEHEHTGGPLGIWLADTNYGDNISGEDGRNPEWSLTFLGECEQD